MSEAPQERDGLLRASRRSRRARRARRGRSCGGDDPALTTAETRSSTLA